ncbi:hypothetical protein MPLDJ20_260036 [Mesorhizobium plurifarium]|uniref:Uncharacterized protein n=1 Tax=Mesorhizobium plurifarium TaxID=69974 RepID=A0A090F6M1_MESPL|nr:hypothetical protein MPLDJ20_260036 [Mesorhizobium plurifarium]
MMGHRRVAGHLFNQVGFHAIPVHPGPNDHGEALFRLAAGAASQRLRTGGAIRRPTIPGVGGIS